MNCDICKKPIVLSPSAAERAAKVGGTPAFYTRLFRRHSDCELAERDKGLRELLQRLPRDPAWITLRP